MNRKWKFLLAVLLVFCTSLAGCKAPQDVFYTARDSLISHNISICPVPLPVSPAYPVPAVDLSKAFVKKQKEVEAWQQEQARIAKEKEEAKRKAYENSRPALCQNEGVGASWVTAVNDQLRAVPAALREQFQNQGWRMYCTTKNLDRSYFGGQFGAVMGVTLYDDRLIYIEDRNDAVTEAPVHEFGHYYDYSLGFISHKGTFGSIFRAEQQAFRRAYGVPGYFNEEELFAEAFWRYLTTDKAAFQAAVPQLYGFFQGLLG